MVRAFPFLILFALSLLVSCDSSTNPSDSSTAKGTLRINPSEFHGIQYETYIFKARVEGYAKSDLKFYWDFGDGNFLLDNRQDVTNRFAHADTFFIRVKAVDYFTDSLIAFDSIQAFVGRPDNKVTIMPRDLDTIITDVSPYDYKLSAVMQIVSSYNPDDCYVKWYVNDSMASVVNHSFSFWYEYPHAGTYMVKAEVYDNSGYMIGADSTNITLRLPEVNMNDLSSSSSISVFLLVDKTSPLINQNEFQNPIAFGTYLTSDTYRKTTTTPTGFELTETIDTGVVNYTFRNNSLRVSFSEDAKTITELHLSVVDSFYRIIDGQYIFSSRAQFSFHLNDIQLASVTATEVLYTAIASTTEMFTDDLLCKTDNGFTPRTGNYEEVDSYLLNARSNQQDYSRVVIVFKR